MQQIMQKSMDFLRRIIVPVGGQGEGGGRLHCHMCALAVIEIRLKTTRLLVVRPS